jgi:DNA mismatch repair protein MutL
VRQLLGTGLSRELIALPLRRGNGVSVEGFVLPASHARKGRRHQCVFLNGRPVEDVVISRALAEGFRGAVADGLHPAAWLWIDLEPNLVDVNVHPAKREVRFHRPLDLRDAILESVTEGLRPAPRVVPQRIEIPIPNPEPIENPMPVVPAVRSVFVAPQPVLANWSEPAAQSAVPVSAQEAKSTVIPEFRILGLLHGRFVLMESADGLVLLDPKAARERIIYETLRRQRSGVPAIQQLLVPVLMEMDPRDFDLLEREKTALGEIGIEIEPFGGSTIQVCGLPACLGIDDVRPFLGAVLDELLHDPVSGARFAFDRLARTLARRAAMLVEPKLAETHPLLEELFACELPYCTADGRPTLSEFGLRELERRFGIGRS